MKIDKGEWEKRKLGNLGDSFIGLTYKPENVKETGTVVLRSGNIQNNSIDLNDIVRVNDIVIKERLFIKENDILICSRNGSAKLVGKSALINNLKESMTFGAFMMVYRSTYNRYVSNFLHSTYFKRQLNRSATTTINQITKSMFDNIEIPLPKDINEQKHIAKTLDTLSDIINLHKKSIEEFDKLIQSTFYDMFGDPVSNDMGWEVEKLGNICSKIGSGATPKGGKENYKQTGISLIRSMNVHNGYFKYKELAYIDDNQAEQLKNVTVEENDVLINITGASVTRSCVVPKEILPARVNQHVCILRCTSSINYIFLEQFLICNTIKQGLLYLAKGGATREAITKPQLENFFVIIPPLQLQEKFANIVNHIEEQKTQVNKALEDSQMLFDSLMQEYFE